MQTHEILPTGMYYTLKRWEMQASVAKKPAPRLNLRSKFGRFYARRKIAHYIYIDKYGLLL